MSRSSLIFFLALCLMVSLAVGFDFRSDLMNIPPGVSRVATQVISSVSGNVTVTIPGNFSVGNVSVGGIVNGSNITWQNLTDATINYTLNSTAVCTENDLFRSDVIVNGTVNASFPFICIPDNKVVDFKVEYGHGNANYLGLGDELVIPNRSAVLFNLARVFNLGYLLTPNQNPENATLFCRYELLPVRTYGSGEVGRESNYVNMTFFWREIRGGYWFRIGVLSQDFSARPPGMSYNVTCQNLTYQFAHTRVLARFTNYSFQVRTELPFTISQFNDSQFIGRNLYLIQNTERYTVHKVKIVFGQANQTAVFEVPKMAQNESLVFRVDNSTTTNLSIYFIPSWFSHSTDPQVLVQSAFFGNSNLRNNTPPSLFNPGNQTAIVGSVFSLQMNGSDPEGSPVVFRSNSTLFNISNTTGLIVFSVVAGSVGNHSTLVNVSDNETALNFTIFNIEVRNRIIPSDANLSRAGLGAEEGNRSTNFSLVADVTNVSGVQFGNRNGTLNFTSSLINAEGQGDAIGARQILIGQGFISLNVSAFHASFNQSALVHFENTSCPHDLKPVVSFAESASNLSGIQGTGRDCVSIGVCRNVSCQTDAAGFTNVSFTIDHFTAFAAFGNANLTIRNNGPKEQHDFVLFNASFINRSSGALISDAACNVTLGDAPTEINVMTVTGGQFTFLKKMDTAGYFSVSVTCARIGVTTISATDNVSISGPVVSGGGGAGGAGRRDSAGGGGSVAGPKKPEAGECVEEWDCTPWTPCLGGDRRRVCHDRAGCGTKIAPPLEFEPCETSVPVINVTFRPTCSDGIKNQGEIGVDCGGLCKKECPVKRELAVESPSTISLACGNGACEDGEECSCELDCGSPALSCPRHVRTGLYIVFFVLLLFILGLLHPLKVLDKVRSPQSK